MFQRVDNICGSVSWYMRHVVVHIIYNTSVIQYCEQISNKYVKEEKSLNGAFGNPNEIFPSSCNFNPLFPVE